MNDINSWLITRPISFLQNLNGFPNSKFLFQGIDLLLWLLHISWIRRQWSASECNISDKTNGHYTAGLCSGLNKESYLQAGLHRKCVDSGERHRNKIHQPIWSKMTRWEPEQITSFHVDPSLLLQANSNTVETAVRSNHLINYSAFTRLQSTECVVYGYVVVEANDIE